MLQYKSLDIAKIIAAILVVALHTQLLCGTEAGYYLRCFCRIAVPFFFVCSSYLFWSKKSSIKKYTKRILLLYLIWLILFLPYVVKTFFLNDQSIVSNVAMFVHSLVFHNTFHASWYLMSSVIAMNLVYWLSKRFSNKTLLIIGIGLFVFSLLSCSYNGIVNRFGIGAYYTAFDRIFVPSNSFFVAFIYVVIGKILAENDRLLGKKESLIYSTIFFFLGGAEIYCVRPLTRLTDAFIFLPFFTFFLFQFLLNVRIRANDELCRLFRKMSIIVYLSHYFFIDLHLHYGMELGTKLFFVVVTEALLLSATIVMLSNKVKILRYLY